MFLFLFFMSFCPCAIPSQHIISRCITKFDGYKEVWTDEKYSYRCQEMSIMYREALYLNKVVSC